jgi:hypothetical protein
MKKSFSEWTNKNPASGTIEQTQVSYEPIRNQKNGVLNNQ